MVGKPDPKQKPPDSLRALHKFYQKASADCLANDTNVFDFGGLQEDVTATKLRIVRLLKGHRLLEVFSRFEGYGEASADAEDVKVYENADLPGLQILPSLLPQSIQRTLLSRLLHRDLSDPKHKTNIHFHHNVPYDSLAARFCSDTESPNGSGGFSFFDCLPESSSCFPAIDPGTHTSLTVAHFLNRKLRWMTLGGQYDWTNKAYPEGGPPGFPEDIAQLTHGIFEHIRPEAAIVNVYTPGDTLSIHRDVSEDSDVGLVSISLGCDAIFIAGLEEAPTNIVRPVVMRLRSGDAVYMTGPSRYAWHSVPQVLAGTCPPWLSDWPASTSLPGAESTVSHRFAAWRGWMANKRINLNIRQMRD
ncbi:MAG: hypothetical protein L6R38_004456 [Xanthoria sp. 2 TBL-2021]|nr:MAG: hypothetical protein L6R38_004456 [Xanthoria sp. 2 TBL-2021]